MSFHRPYNVTHNILITIAIIFAILAGISAIAWLLPNLFNSIGNTLIKLTGNKDIMLNVQRINGEPTLYTIIFAISALFIRWIAGKF